jgi:hypothetical protein
MAVSISHFTAHQHPLGDLRKLETAGFGWAGVRCAGVRYAGVRCLAGSLTKISRKTQAAGSRDWQFDAGVGADGNENRGGPGNSPRRLLLGSLIRSWARMALTSRWTTSLAGGGQPDLQHPAGYRQRFITVTRSPYLQIAGAGQPG